jgi:GT2 family glycosyltransferase
VTVANNIRAQRFPNIEIIIPEEDGAPHIDMDRIIPAKHIFTQSNTQFCKSAAFNIGVKNVNTDHVVLHDADILVPAGYTADMFRLLQDNDGCHVGKQVLYMRKDSTSIINTQHVVDTSGVCERVVDYFEGGSVGIHKSTFVAIGGFDEAFVGYGMEDCEFFRRLSSHGKFFNQRTVKMVHLWHEHAGDWQSAHQRNKAYMQTIQAKPPSIHAQELSVAWARKY